MGPMRYIPRNCDRCGVAHTYSNPLRPDELTDLEWICAECENDLWAEEMRKHNPNPNRDPLD